MGMTGSYYLCECRFRCRGSLQRDFSSASTRQQSMIIEELRKSQMHKKHPNPKTNKSHKIVPINSHVMTIRRSDDGRTCNLDIEMKRQLRRVARDQKENNSLRHALTHPTIQIFLRDFMVAQSLESILNFYLDVIEIIALNRNCHSKGSKAFSSKYFHQIFCISVFMNALQYIIEDVIRIMFISCALIEAFFVTSHPSRALPEHKLTYACIHSSINCHTDAGDLWRKVAYKYILDNAPEPVPLNPMHREMIVGQFLRGKKQPKAGYCLMPFSSCDKVDKIDKRALQGLFLAQHDAFHLIKVST